jgi:hypothetical protein
MRTSPPKLLALTLLLGCAHKRTPAERAMVARGDCKELLRAADAARALEEPAVAQDLAQSCTQPGLLALVEASPPEEALLWCGRAAAAAPPGQPSCDAKTLAGLSGRLHPRLRVGPADSSAPPDPLLSVAVGDLAAETNLVYDASAPEVFVGRLSIAVDHVTSSTVAQAKDASGKTQRVPATQHRFVARAEAQVELLGKTRVLRASDEARDTTWEAAPKLAVAARFEPSVPSEDELRRLAARAWVRALSRALAAAPPEAIQVTDARSCVAYGLALNLGAADPGAAAAGRGDPSKISACETLLGEPAGAGIPVP